LDLDNNLVSGNLDRLSQRQTTTYGCIRHVVDDRIRMVHKQTRKGEKKTENIK
jgi:hypothetical protein